MKRLPYLYLVLIAVFTMSLSAATASAQQEQETEGSGETACTVNFVEIISEVEQVCTGVGRDQVCYGNVEVNAIPRQSQMSLNFSRPGDSTNVSLISSLYLSALDDVNNVWGIAQMRLLANLSQQTPEDVTLLLFGDVRAESSAVDRATMDLTVNPTFAANIRNTPSETASIVIDVAQPGETVHALARLEDSSWIRIQEDQAGRVGWISATLLQLNDVDIESLPVDNANDAYFGAMQAFYFQSGSSPSCGNSIVDGLLIQTPEGVARLSLLINEVTVELMGTTSGGATAFVQANSQDGMAISMFRGGANVTANNQTVYVDRNQTVNISLDENLSPSGSFSEPDRMAAGMSDRIPMMEYINQLFPIRLAADGSPLGGTGTSLNDDDTAEEDEQPGWIGKVSDRDCVDQDGNPKPGNACHTPSADGINLPSESQNNPPGQSTPPGQAKKDE
jgi:hypothetical protein